LKVESIPSQLNSSPVNSFTANASNENLRMKEKISEQFCGKYNKIFKPKIRNICNPGNSCPNCV